MAIHSYTGTAGTLLQKVHKRGRLVCGVIVGFDPFGYIGADGGPVGYECDFATGLAEHLGVRPDLVALEANQRLPALRDCHVDVLAALFVPNAERATHADFSLPYGRDDCQLLVRAAAPWQHADELAHACIAVVAGTSLPQELDRRYPNAILRAYPDANAAHRGLAAGDVDALGLRATSLIDLMSRPIAGVAMRLLPEVLLAPATGFAVRKGEPALLEAMNGFLTEAERSGLAQRIFDRWLGAESRFRMTRRLRIGHET